jgi:hypothetical protein
MIWTFPLTVVEVLERKSKRHVSGSGDATVFKEYSIGWYVTFNDYTSRYFGMEKPDLAPGDKMVMKLKRSQ